MLKSHGSSLGRHRATRERKKNPFTKEPCRALSAWKGEKSLNDAQRSCFIFHSTSDAAQGDGLKKLISFGWKSKKKKNKNRTQKKKPVFNKMWMNDAMVPGTRGMELLIASFPGARTLVCPLLWTGMCLSKKVSTSHNSLK